MTTIIHSITEWRQIRQDIKSSQSIGFVPTMGNLHAGHASLLERAKSENDIVVLSIFVNPTQFNDFEDLKKYPRTIPEDIAIAKRLLVSYVLAPKETELYADNYRYKIHETMLSQQLEGQFRPGHFSGMLTIVLKLLLLVQPARVYLGEKDFQQWQLVHDMVKAFFIETEVVRCATIRNENGLPLSSRNSRLTPEQIKLAERFVQIVHAGERCFDIIQELEAEGIRVDYVEDREGRRFAAVRIGDVRLIDNFSLR